MQHNKYLDLVGFSTPEEAYKKIQSWVSGLSNDEHLIRSTIFDIHAGIELLLKQIIYHYLKALVFQTNNEKENKKALEPFDKMVERLNFSSMYRILKPILNSWPSPDLANIQPINDLRNQIAHSSSIDKIEYKGRNPFKDGDAFAQVFFEAWAIKKELTEFFYRAIKDPQSLCKKYYEVYKKCLKEHKGKK